MSRLMLCGLVSWVILFSPVPVGADDKAVEFVMRHGQVTRDEKARHKPVTGVVLHSPEFRDAGLKVLAGLKQLTTLDLSNTKVTDAGLKELGGLTKLTTLVLSDAPVTALAG